jgi:hypothetical protein
MTNEHLRRGDQAGAKNNRLGSTGPDSILGQSAQW